MLPPGNNSNQATAAPDYSSFTTTSSSTFSDPFPLITSTQLSTLQRVVSSLSSTQSTWSDLEFAYKQERVDDEEYYELFLKLSLMPGLNWKEKWEGAKISLGERGVEAGGSGGGADGSGKRSRRKSVGGLDLLKAKMDQVTSVPRRPPSNPPPPPPPPPPAFASSSSSLAAQRPRSTPPPTTTTTPRPAVPSSRRPHPAPPPSSSSATPREFLIRTTATDNRGYSSSDDYVGVPSPSSSLLPRQTRRSSFQTTTPRSSSHPLLNSRILAASTLPTPVAAAAPPSTLDLRAQSFRRLSLLSKTFSLWSSRYSHLKRQQTDLDAARQSILTSWAFTHWRGRLDGIKGLERKVEELRKEREKREKREVWRVWTGKVRERRRGEWEMGLRIGWEKVRGKWRERARRECFEHWKRMTLESKAINFRRHSLLLPTIHHWRLRLDRLVIMHSRAEKMLERRDGYAKRGAMRLWIDKTELERRGREWRDEREWRVKEGIWGWWKGRMEHAMRIRELEDMADEFQATSLKRQCLSSWVRSLSRIKNLESRANALSTLRSHHLLQHHFNLWLTTWSGRLLHHSLTFRLLRACLSKWTEKHYQISIDLDARSNAFKTHHNGQLKETCFIHWREVLRRKKDLQSYAEGVGEGKLMRRVLEGWREKRDERELDGVKALVAREFFGKRRVWMKWREEGRKKVVGRWVGERRERRKREVWEFWLAKMRKNKADQALVEVFQGAVDTRILSDVLSLWTSRVVDIRAREMETTAIYEGSLVGRGFSRWTDRCITIGEQHDLAESFLEVKAEELKAKSFRNWLTSTRRNLILSSRLEEHLEEDRRQTKQVAFDHWRELSMRGLEIEVRRRREEGLKEEGWRVWKGRTKLMPALQFYKATTRRRLFMNWREQVTDPELVRTAIEVDREKVVGRSFDVWRIKAQARLAVRSVNRFRSLAASSTSFTTARSSPSPPTSATRQSFQLSPRPSPPSFLSRMSSTPSPSPTGRTSTPPLPPTPSTPAMDRSDALRARLRKAAEASRKSGNKS